MTTSIAIHTSNEGLSVYYTADYSASGWIKNPKSREINNFSRIYEYFRGHPGDLNELSRYMSTS